MWFYSGSNKRPVPPRRAYLQTWQSKDDTILILAVVVRVIVVNWLSVTYFHRGGRKLWVLTRVFTVQPPGLTVYLAMPFMIVVFRGAAPQRHLLVGLQ